MKKRAFVLLATLTFLIFQTPLVKAQVGSISGTINDVSINVSPKIPQANQQVTLTIKTFLINVTTADISWSVDGKKVQSGIGLTSFTFTTKDVGESTTIDCSILAVNGYPINKQIVVTPSSVDILWEATDSAVPPFYKGKALPISESTLKFVAIPNIKTNTGAYVNPSDMVYMWQNDFDLDRNGSGYGKDSYTVEMGVSDQGENIGVTAQTRDGGLSADQQIQTGVYDPKILWYAESPLYGPQFERAINDGFSIKSSDISVFAEPLFASPKNILSSDLSYLWQLNGNDAGDQKPANILTLHRNNSNQGDATIDLTVNNSQKYLEELKSTLILHLL